MKGSSRFQARSCQALWGQRPVLRTGRTGTIWNSRQLHLLGAAIQGRLNGLKHRVHRLCAVDLSQEQARELATSVS